MADEFNNDPGLVDALDPEQYHVTHESGTDPPFSDEHWASKEPGLAARAARLENLFRLLARKPSNVTDQGATVPGFDSGVWSPRSSHSGSPSRGKHRFGGRQEGRIDMAEGVVLTGAVVLVATAPRGSSPAGSLSIMVTARVLAEIDILIAKPCVDIDLADAHGAQRNYEMVTTPIRLDTLSGDPAVVIRAINIVERTDLVVAVRFEVNDRFNQRTLLFHHDFGDVCLTAESPVATRRLPLSRFRSDQ